MGVDDRRDHGSVRGRGGEGREGEKRRKTGGEKMEKEKVVRRGVRGGKRGQG